MQLLTRASDFISKVIWPRFLRRKWRNTLLLALLAGWLFCLPRELFRDPYSTVLLDTDGNLMGARIARDGQWRFPLSEEVPDRFATALVTFEDKRFYYHPGVDPIAMARALWLNLSNGEVRSGGSTLSMQVIRLARKGKSRSVWEKLVEMFLATRLELRYSKSEILATYAAHAPFGGNVVGLEAAAWKYMGRPAQDLSWAEAATLAVLPNAPGLIHPGRNRDVLRNKRNRLLDWLLEAGKIDSLEWELAREEPLPDQARPIPNHAPHLLERARMELGQLRVESTLDIGTQLRANDIVAQHYRRMASNGIHNIAMVVVNMETGGVMAYVGNSPGTDPGEGYAVDVVTAPRSTGSILKPFLHAAMLDEGELLPDQLLADIPSYFGGFVPANFDNRFSGAVPASEALSRSLNIPAVRMLQSHGVGRFREDLRQVGLTTLFRPAEDYGLSLILGGAEATLWDLAGAYTSMGQILDRFSGYNGRYEQQAFRPLVYQKGQERPPLRDEDRDKMVEQVPLSAGSIWCTFQAMQEITRPGEEASWRLFGSARRVAWKTGTSFGFRDAWAIGVTPEFLVAVWVGNADGEGRPGLIGVEAAAPVMFDMMNALPRRREWFRQPLDDLLQARVCRQSGHRAGPVCPQADTAWIPLAGIQTDLCPYHQVVWRSSDLQFRVHSDCESPGSMVPDSMFVLPAIQESFYRNTHPDYRPVPPWRSGCEPQLTKSSQPLSLMYPHQGSKIYLPVNLDGSSSSMVAEATHSLRGTAIFWHLDGTYLGQTEALHQQLIQVDEGAHVLTLVDEVGNTVVCDFEVLAAER